MNAGPVRFNSSSPARTPGPAQASSPAQAQPRLRSDGGDAFNAHMLNRPDAYEHDDNNAGLSDDDALLLQTFHEQLTALRPPLSARLDDIVNLFSGLKNAEHSLRAVLVYHPRTSGLTRLKRSLSVFIKQLDAALSAQQGPNRLDPASLSQAQIQTLCQGLAVCVPSEAGLLFHPDYRQQDGLCLQGVTDALLKRAMALGLPDALQANGEVLDILNWLSRALKAGLLAPSAVIDLCFEKSLVLILDWTGGDQCRQLLSDHNVGRCAVQCATIFNRTTLNLGTTALGRLNNDTDETNGQRLQRCILNLCSDAVLNRLMTAPADTVSLLNICNTVKDAIDKRLLADTDPALLPALGSLVKVIAGLSERELLGVGQDCRPLANFSNFLRALAERRVRQDLIFQTALPMIVSAACTLIDCVKGQAFFAYARPSGQSLSNLLSFVKLCDKLLLHRSTAATTASVTPSSSDSVTALLTRDALIAAGGVLTLALQTCAVTNFSKPNAVGGLLAGLTYLWQRNLAPRSPALQEFVAALLAQAGKTRVTWNDKSKGVVLPALQTLLEMEMVTLEAAQPLLARLMPQHGATRLRTMQDLAREIKRLGVMVEVVDAPEPALVAVMPALARPAPVGAPPTGAARSIPGLTRIRLAPAPVYRPQTTASSSSASTHSTTSTHSSSTSTSSTTAVVEQPYQKARKVAKPGRVADASDSYDASVDSASDEASGDEGLVAHKAGTTAAGKRENTQKSHRTKKNKASVRVGRTAPQGQDAALCKAIVQGKPALVQTLMGQATTWPDSAITTMLDALMRELALELVDQHIIAALDRFFTAVFKAAPVTGRAALTAYFLEHPPQYNGLQMLLAEKKVLPDPRYLDTPQKLLDLLAAADANTRALWLTMPTVLSRLQEKNEMDDTVLHLAAKQNCRQVVHSLLGMPQAAGMVHQENMEQMTPLTVAAFMGHENVVRALLAHTTASAQARRLNSSDANALMAAADQGHAKVVSLLLANPTAAEQARAVDKSGVNALALAAQHGHANVVKLLLGIGISREQGSVFPKKGGGNALILAAEQGHAKVVRHLLATPSGPAFALATNEEGWNALAVAAQEGHAEVVGMLLKQPSAQAQSVVVNRRNYNALMAAAQEGHAEVVRLLLALPSAEAQVGTVSKTGWNALMIAAESGYVNVVALLLGNASASARICAHDPNGANALILAASHGHTEAVGLLLAHPSAAQQARAQYKNGANALMMAAENGYTGVMSLLLGAGMAREQASAVMQGGVDALMLAAQGGHAEGVSLLLAHPDTAGQAAAVDSNGCNALIRAANRPDGAEVVKLLLVHPSAETQASAVMTSGWTALSTAINGGYVEPVRLLLATQSGRAQANRSTIAGKGLFGITKTGDKAIIALLRQAQPDA